MVVGDGVVVVMSTLVVGGGGGGGDVVIAWKGVGDDPTPFTATSRQ